MLQKNSLKKIIEIIGTILCFYSVFCQYIIRLNISDLSAGMVTLNHFSFFTILTNLLVGVFFISQLLPKENKLHLFFASHKTALATTIYIFMVGLLFNILLRKIYHPSGIEGINNNLLHVFIPLLVQIYWILFIQKKHIQYFDIAYWLVYPILYFTYLLFKGHFTHFYQYPFFNVDELGYSRVLLHSLFLIISWRKNYLFKKV